MIKIKVKLFAAYQEAYGVSEIVLQFLPETPVHEVLEQLLQEHPELEKWREVTRFGINFALVDPYTPLKEGDEVVLIPPVSGG